MPRLPDFLAEYPDIETLHERRRPLVDLIREGIDCVLRVGDLPGQRHDRAPRRHARARSPAPAPAYIDRFGHARRSSMRSTVIVMVGFRSLSDRGVCCRSSSSIDGARARGDAAARSMSVNGAGELSSPPRALGLGLIQVPRYHVEADLANEGRWSQVLSDCPPLADAGLVALSAQPPASPRVRVFIDYVMRAFGGPDRWRRLPRPICRLRLARVGDDLLELAPWSGCPARGICRR